MLDTIRLKFPIALEFEQLQGWIQKITSTQSGGFRQSFIYNPKINDDVMLKYTYYPLGYDCKPLLLLEFSLPKLLYGNNFQMLGSIDGTIKLANIFLAHVPNAPILDLAEGILIRLDICYNHQVGDAVDDYIKALGNLDYPHRRTKYHRYEGVEFKAKHITTKFYNKQHECGIPEAFGILRQETTIMSSKAIQKLFGRRKPTLLDVTRDFVIQFLNDELKKLGLLNNSIGTHDTSLNTLCSSYGELAGVYYFNLQGLKMDKSRKQLSQHTKTHPRSLDRRLRKILDAGLPLTLTDREEPLPPLVIDL